MPSLCLTLAEQDLATLQKKIDRFSGDIDYLEVRLDYLDELRWPEIPESSTRFIATLRPTREGGRFNGSEQQRVEFLRGAGSRGFTWVDLEHDAKFEREAFTGVRVLRSFHAFRDFPPNLGDLYRRVADLPGDGTKLAVAVSSTEQLVDLLSLLESLPKSTAWVVLGMGAQGESSRVLAPLLGSLWSYVAEDSSRAVAPGQLSLRQCRELYRVESWQSVPELYGEIGEVAVPSLALRLLNALFERHDRAAICLPFRLDRLEPWFEFLGGSSLPFRGFSLSPRLKSEVGPFLAARAGPEPIDTLVWKGPGWIGLNSESPAQGTPEGSGDAGIGLIEQVAFRFRSWTGMDADLDFMRKWLNKDSHVGI